MMRHLRRLAVAPFETAAATAAIIIGIPEALDPTGLINEAIPTLARAWSIGYAIAGVRILVVLATGRRGVEVVGLVMLGCGTTVQAIAVAVATDGIGGAPIVASRVAFVVAALVRVHTIVPGRDIVQIDLTDVTVHR